MTRARDLADSADLAFDGDTLKIDSTNNRVGINEASPASALHIQNADSAATGLRMRNTADESVEFYYANANADADFIVNRTGSGAADIGLKHTGDVYFTSGNVGIGNSSPAEMLTVAGAGLFTGALNATPSGAGHIVSLSGNESRIRAYGATASTGYLTIRTGGGGGSGDSESVRVTSTGNVGINLTVPDEKLHVAAFHQDQLNLFLRFQLT